MKEVWKPIKDHNHYLISNKGRVKSLKGKKSKILKHGTLRNGYLYVNLWSRNKYKTKTIHRLIAIAFIPNPDNKPQINHKDLNKHNNSINNLEWVTNKENALHAIGMGVDYGKGARGRRGALNGFSRAVVKMDMAGNDIKMYESAKLTGVYNIDRAIKNDLTAGGYKWRYA